ncbi:MAG: dipeptidase [Gemmatimonadaceae bacterium]|nr:dipeptidase [Gemmatimonadaceae bacterium]
MLACAFLIPADISAQAAESNLARAKRILRTTPLVDGHNDLAWRIREDKSAPRDVEAYDLRSATPGHTDLARMKEGMVGAQFWSVYIPGEIRDSGYARVQLEELDIARRIIARYPERLALATHASDIRTDFAQGKVASFLGMEGGHAIENSLGALRAYYDLGVRYMTLTHNVTLDWADAALDEPKHGGLTPFGKEVVREMNRLGMLVDLAHVSPATMSAALDVSEAPVIFSHSGARALVDHPRNVPDSILARVRTNGGIVMVPFVNSFVSAAVRAHDVAEAQAAKDAAARSPGDSAGVEREMASCRRTLPSPPRCRRDRHSHTRRAILASANWRVEADRAFCRGQCESAPSPLPEASRRT